MIKNLSFGYRLLLFFLLFFVGMSGFALDFDVSVDDEIRKNYNPSKLELESLPPLPKVNPTSDVRGANYGSVKRANQLPALSKPIEKPIISAIDRTTALKLPYGTKFKVKSLQGLSDSTREGSRISFSSVNSVTKSYVTIPQGTVFHGVVENSHNPQISGNGGLLVLKIDSMNYNGKNVSVNAKITKVNNKKVFINNVKGKRLYWHNVAKQVDKGDKFYKKTRRVSAKLSSNPIGTIISPIPTVIGMGTYAINFVGAPVAAIFSRGGRISIPMGTVFEIKLIESAYIPR